jgi:hypothetical protein
MDDKAGDLQEHPEKHDGNSPITIPESSIFSYYRDGNEETGGLQVKWTIRVATGADARRWMTARTTRYGSC